VRYSRLVMVSDILVESVQREDSNLN